MLTVGFSSMQFFYFAFMRHGLHATEMRARGREKNSWYSFADLVTTVDTGAVTDEWPSVVELITGWNPALITQFLPKLEQCEKHTTFGSNCVHHV